MRFTFECTLLATVLGVLFTSPAAAALDLAGKVSNAAGAAIEGATIFVYIAAPKVGTSPYCPSCYPDCVKSAKSDATGSFAIAGLSSELVFKLLVVGKDFVPQFVPNVVSGEKRIEVALAPRLIQDVTPQQTVRGRIIDPSGAPIFGAVVEANGADFGQTRQFGALRDTDPLAVTDEAGEFVLTSRMEALALFVRVTARLFANQSLQLATGKPHVITMTEGATLSGRVMKDGRPLPNVGVGVSAQDRAAGSYLGHFEVGTDADGRFTFLNLPPKTDYYVYGLMETVGPHGMIPMRPVHVGRDREKTDVGDFAVRPAHRLAGKVVLEDAERLPPKTRLLISRDRAWDSRSVELGPDGEFDVPGLSAETVSLSVRIPGYIISPKNGSYDPVGRRLMGRIDTDVTGLQVLLEKGAHPQGPRSVASLPRWKPGEHPRERPLRGAEAIGK